MKNSKIHLGLPNSEIRDFLSLSIVKNFDYRCDRKRKEINHRPDDAIGWSIENMENEIDYMTKQLQLLKELQSVQILIKMNGWMEFDVSDHTENDRETILQMGFIGTQAEYDAFISNSKVL